MQDLSQALIHNVIHSTTRLLAVAFSREGGINSCPLKPTKYELDYRLICFIPISCTRMPKRYTHKIGKRWHEPDYCVLVFSQRGRVAWPPGRLHGQAYYLPFVCIPWLNGRIRCEQPWSELIFPRRFDKLDLNFSKLGSYCHPVRNHNPRGPHQNCLRLHFSTPQETCQIKKKRQTVKLQCRIWYLKTSI